MGKTGGKRSESLFFRLKADFFKKEEEVEIGGNRMPFIEVLPNTIAKSQKIVDRSAWIAKIRLVFADFPEAPAFATQQSHRNMA